MKWNEIKQNHFYVIESSGIDFFYVDEKTDNHLMIYELFFDSTLGETKPCLPFPVEITTQHWNMSQWSILKGTEISVSSFFNYLFKQEF